MRAKEEKKKRERAAMADAFMDFGDSPEPLEKEEEIEEKPKEEDEAAVPNKKYANTVNKIEVGDFKPYVKKGQPSKKQNKP